MRNSNNIQRNMKEISWVQKRIYTASNFKLFPVFYVLFSFILFYFLIKNRVYCKAQTNFVSEQQPT